MIKRLLLSNSLWLIAAMVGLKSGLTIWQVGVIFVLGILAGIILKPD